MIAKSVELVARTKPESEDRDVSVLDLERRAHRTQPQMSMAGVTRSLKTKRDTIVAVEAILMCTYPPRQYRFLQSRILSKFAPQRFVVAENPVFGQADECRGKLGQG